MTDVHRYYLPSTPTDSWSVWLVDEETGTLCIFGDYGTWAHTWGVSGRSKLGKADFRHELLRFDSDYIGKKLSIGVARVTNVPKTVKALRTQVLDARRRSYIGRHTAEEAWRCLDAVADGECSLSEFLREHDHGDWWELVCDEPAEADWLAHLMSISLPRFKEMARADLGAVLGGLG